MRRLCQEWVMCERKVKKDAQVAVVSRAAYFSRAPLTDASSPALSGWGRPAWSLRVNRWFTYMRFFFEEATRFVVFNRETHSWTIKIEFVICDDDVVSHIFGGVFTNLLDEHASQYANTCGESMSCLILLDSITF